jgi:hypothetical protein
MAGAYYVFNAVVQVRAANLSEVSQLRVTVDVKAMEADSKFLQVLLIPTHGVNSRGQVIQNYQLTAIYAPGVDNGVVQVSVTEAKRRGLINLVGNIQLTKANVTLLGTDSSPFGNLAVLTPVSEKLDELQSKLKVESSNLSKKLSAVQSLSVKAKAAKVAYAKNQTSSNKKKLNLANSALAKAKSDYSKATKAVAVIKNQLNIALKN